MRRIRVIPVLLIQNGGLVKSVKFRNHKYVGDPINAVKVFNDKEVDEIVVLDISATAKGNGPDVSFIKDICGEAFMPLGYGGGINSLEQIRTVLFNGAEKVIVNTACFDNPELITKAAAQFGSQSIVASIDFRKNLFGKYKVFRNNGTKSTSFTPVEFARKMQDLGTGELFINSIDNDGTYKGYDLDVISQVSDAVSIPIVSCGGASEVEDFARAVSSGASAVAAGSMFVFQRPHQAVLISYPDQQTLNEKLYATL